MSTETKATSIPNKMEMMEDLPFSQGQGGISAKVLAHSKSEWNKEIITFELEYPRFIHAEFMTHRLFSRNCASSRAIPHKKMTELIRSRPAMPVFWGKNQTGMQAYEELDPSKSCVEIGGMRMTPAVAWVTGMDHALEVSEALAEAGFHKQIVNRITEPYQMIKTVVTATEYANFFHLRNHHMAQPEIRELAKCMLEALEKSIPVKRGWGGYTKDAYHLPYVSDDERRQYPIEDLIKMSVARCAAVSYRNEDYTLDKSKEVYARLIDGDRKHSSALEHVASVMKSEKASAISANVEIVIDIEEGVSHIDMEGRQWSGNFKGWVQHRKMLKDECVW